MDISCEPSVSGAVVLSPRGPARHLKAESHQRTWFSASGRTPAPGSSSLIHKQGSSWRVPARLCVHLQRLGRWPLLPTCLSTDVQQHLSGTPPLRKACAWATILGQTVSLGRVDTALGMWGAVWPSPDQSVVAFPCGLLWQPADRRLGAPQWAVGSLGSVPTAWRTDLALYDHYTDKCPERWHP